MSLYYRIHWKWNILHWLGKFLPFSVHKQLLLFEEANSIMDARLQIYHFIPLYGVHNIMSQRLIILHTGYILHYISSKSFCSYKITVTQ